MLELDLLQLLVILMLNKVILLIFLNCIIFNLIILNIAAAVQLVFIDSISHFGLFNVSKR
jgi:hypothetical protein